MILVIDNYDSFTYNLVQYLGELGADLKVVRNDAISLDQIKKLKPSHILISPGPGRPEDAGISESVIKTFYRTIPILGVCLGHQAMGQVFGAKVGYAPILMHGKSSMVFHDGKSLFKNIPSPFKAGRYHSLVVEESTLPPEIEVTSRTKDGTVMGLRHKKFPMEGIQFHPESILTEHGKDLLKNFMQKR